MLIEEEEQRMKSLYKELQEFEEVEAPEIPLEELQAMIESLQDNWVYLETETQKELIQSMFRKIVILKEKDGWSIKELQTV